jgi:hypothetical protein
MVGVGPADAKTDSCEAPFPVPRIRRNQDPHGRWDGI